MKLWIVNLRLAEDLFRWNEFQVLQLQSIRKDQCSGTGRTYETFACSDYSKNGNDTILLDVRTLDKDAMGRFFPYADIPAIIDNMKANKDSTSYNNSFLYPRNGAGSFIQILYDALDSSKF